MSDTHTGPGYVTIWAWLVILLLAGMGVFAVEMGKTIAVATIFSIALVKAYLVLRHFMHLKDVPPFLYAIVGVPVVLVIAMVIALLPDIAYHTRAAAPAAGHSASH